MTTRVARTVLVLLAAVAAYVGLWALLAPHSFYDSFPGGGRHWVSMDGPFNEHLVRDVGGLYVAMLVLGVGAAIRPAAGIVRLTGLAWLAFSVPHLAYHTAHLEMFSPLDQILNVVLLGAAVVLGAVLCLPLRTHERVNSTV